MHFEGEILFLLFVRLDWRVFNMTLSLCSGSSLSVIISMLNLILYKLNCGKYMHVYIHFTLILKRINIRNLKYFFNIIFVDEIPVMFIKVSHANVHSRSTNSFKPVQ